MWSDTFTLDRDFVLDVCRRMGADAVVDYDGGDVIDISDLVYLVDYMFTGGPAPQCWEEANVDGSGPINPPLDGPADIDISDLVYLVDFMFTGGPPPAPCP